MNLSSLVSTLVSSDVAKNIAGAVKSDSGSVKKVISAALPTLLDGAKEQSADEASGFADALLAHSQDDTSNISKFIKKVDLADGKKILGHLLGDNLTDKVGEISRAAGVSKKSTAGILSAAAPLLMSLLGKQAAAEKGPDGLSSIVSSLFSGVDLGGMLSGLLTDNASEEKEEEKPAAGGLFGGLLGKLFKK